LSKEIDDFSEAAREFFDSRAYRLYRYMPFFRPEGIGPENPDGPGADHLRLQPMAANMQLHVFRIMQEALNNVEKHAGATETVVTLRNSIRDGKPWGVFISVSDDGQSFPRRPKFPNPAHVKFTAPPAYAVHFGIRGMIEHCAILQGELFIESEKGEGTLVCLEAPLDTRSGGQSWKDGESDGGQSWKDDPANLSPQ
jgi:anti-sigma regulatory factor (Ser/Thr protein kinase)